MNYLFGTVAEANNHIKNLDEELAIKYDETGKHREEITSLLGQLVSQRHKIREVVTRLLLSLTFLFSLSFSSFVIYLLFS